MVVRLNFHCYISSGTVVLLKFWLWNLQTTLITIGLFTANALACIQVDYTFISMFTSTYVVELRIGSVFPSTYLVKPLLFAFTSGPSLSCMCEQFYKIIGTWQSTKRSLLFWQKNYDCLYSNTKIGGWCSHHVATLCQNWYSSIFYFHNDTSIFSLRSLQWIHQSLQPNHHHATSTKSTSISICGRCNTV